MLRNTVTSAIHSLCFKQRNTAQQHRIRSLCLKVRNTATGAWKENTATATTASARTGLDSKAKATAEAVEGEDTTEESNLSWRLLGDLEDNTLSVQLVIWTFVWLKIVIVLI